MGVKRLSQLVLSIIKLIDNDIDLSKLIQMTFIEKLLIIIAVWSIVIFLFRKLK